MEQVVSAAERWAKEIKAAVCRYCRRRSVAGLFSGKSEALSTELLSVGGGEPVQRRAQERRSAARRKEFRTEQYIVLSMKVPSEFFRPLKRAPGAR